MARLPATWRSTGAGAGGKTDREGRSAGSDRAGRHRSHRDQSADRACAEIADARFPHRLSDEGFSTTTRRRATFEQAPLENQIDRDADSGRSKSQARLQGVAARSQAFQRTRSRHGPDPARISRDRRDCLDAGRISAVEPAAGVRPGAGRRRPGDPVFSENDVVAALKKAAERGVPPAEYPLGCGLRAQAQRYHLRRCHQTRGIGGFHFPGVDWMAANPSNSTVVPGSPHFFGDQVRRRDILAAFVTAGRRTIRAGSPAVRNCAAALNLPAPNMTTAGARIAISNRPMPRAMIAASGRGAAPRDFRARSWTPCRAWGCALSRSASNRAGP